jgi:hypothetical protein
MPLRLLRRFPSPALTQRATETHRPARRLRATGPMLGEALNAQPGHVVFHSFFNDWYHK